MGVGWYWFGPVAYVDTSDMWLEGSLASDSGERRWPLRQPRARCPRGAGGLVRPKRRALGGALGVHPVLPCGTAQLQSPDGVRRILRLEHLLERPQPASAGPGLAGAGPDPGPSYPSELEGHRLELLYGLTSVLYVAFSAVLTVVLYRLVVQG